MPFLTSMIEFHSNQEIFAKSKNKFTLFYACKVEAHEIVEPWLWVAGSSLKRIKSMRDCDERHGNKFEGRASKTRGFCTHLGQLSIIKSSQYAIFDKYD